MKMISLLALMICFTTASFSQQGSQNVIDSDAPEISFEKLTHDYGTIHAGGDGNCEFKFTNTGKQPLIITTVRASCGCTVPSYPRDPIMPGQSSAIKVRYDTNRQGVIMKQVTVVSNAKSSTLILTIKGNVVPKPAEELPMKKVDANSAPVMKIQN
jgi:hypothetical protein